jgi:hypothetical protein
MSVIVMMFTYSLVLRLELQRRPRLEYNRIPALGHEISFLAGPDPYARSREGPLKDYAERHKGQTI